MQLLCRVEEISPEFGKEVCIDGRQGNTWIMLFRLNDKVLAYQNSCPHQGKALNFAPDRFILSDENQLVCPHHGAAFELKNGLCVSGPCKGSSLQAVAITIADGEVLLQKSRFPES